MVNVFTTMTGRNIPSLLAVELLDITKCWLRGGEMMVLSTD